MGRTKYVTCPDCDGSGCVDSDGDACAPDDPDREECESCGGRGEVLEGDE